MDSGQTNLPPHSPAPIVPPSPSDPLTASISDTADLTEPGLVRSESRSSERLLLDTSIGRSAYARISSRLRVRVLLSRLLLDSLVKLMSAGRMDSLIWTGLEGPEKGRIEGIGRCADCVTLCGVKVVVSRLTEVEDDRTGRLLGVS